MSKDKPIDFELVRSFLDSSDCYHHDITRRRVIEIVRRAGGHAPTYDLRTDDDPGALDRAREFLAIHDGRSS